MIFVNSLGRSFVLNILRLLSKKILGPEFFINRLLLDDLPVVLTVIGLWIIFLLLMIIVLILIKR